MLVYILLVPFNFFENLLPYYLQICKIIFFNIVLIPIVSEISMLIVSYVSYRIKCMYVSIFLCCRIEFRYSCAYVRLCGFHITSSFFSQQTYYLISRCSIDHIIHLHVGDLKVQTFLSRCTSY